MLRLLCARRHDRVRRFVAESTRLFAQDGAVSRFVQSVDTLLEKQQQLLTLCRQACILCYLPCLCEAGHSGGHHCGTDHKCSDTCYYCRKDAESMQAQQPQEHKVDEMQVREGACLFFRVSV